MGASCGKEAQKKKMAEADGAGGEGAGGWALLPVTANDALVLDQLAKEAPSAALFTVVSKAMLVMKRKAAEARAAVEQKRADGTLSPTSSQKSEAADRPSELARSESIRAGMLLLDQRLARMQLRSVAMGDDGNCQFRSFAHQLFGSQDAHEYVRGEAVGYMRAHADAFSFYFEGGEFERFLQKMARPMTWGDELTLKAVAERFHVTIHVLTSSEENWSLKYEPDDGKSVKDIFLLYISPIHYNVFVHVDDRRGP